MIRDRMFRIYASHFGLRNIHTAYAGLTMLCSDTDINEVVLPWFTSPTLGQLWDRPSVNDVRLKNMGNLVTSTDSRWHNDNNRRLQDKIRARMLNCNSDMDRPQLWTVKIRSQNLHNSFTGRHRLRLTALTTNHHGGGANREFWKTLVYTSNAHVQWNTCDRWSSSYHDGIYFDSEELS